MLKLGVLCILPILTFAAEPTSRDWYQAIRENKISELKAMAGSKAAVNITDSRGTTPLMQAAMICSSRNTAPRSPFAASGGPAFRLDTGDPTNMPSGWTFPY